MVDFSKRDLRGQDMTGQALLGANLQGADLRDAQLAGCDLSAAVLVGAYLGGANLNRTILRDANLMGADFSGASLLGADLRGANFEDSRWRRAKLLGAATAPEALLGVDTFGAAFGGVDSLSFCVRSAASPARSVAWFPDSGFPTVRYLPAGTTTVPCASGTPPAGANYGAARATPPPSRALLGTTTAPGSPPLLATGRCASGTPPAADALQSSFSVRKDGLRFVPMDATSLSEIQAGCSGTAPAYAVLRRVSLSPFSPGFALALTNHCKPGWIRSQCATLQRCAR
jgi:hypothetical protein